MEEIAIDIHIFQELVPNGPAPGYNWLTNRNEIAAFSDRLLNAPEIYFRDGKLYFRPLMGSPSELVETAPMIFAFRGMNMPLICFVKNQEGTNIMMIGGSYFEKTSNFWAISKRSMIVLALLFTLSSAVLGIIALIGALVGKIRWPAFISRMMPMIGVLALVLAVRNLFEVQRFSYELSKLDSVNFFSLVIFLGTSVFAIVSILSLFIIVRNLAQFKKRWFKIYFLLMSLSLCLVAVILWQNGWIGLRTWAL